MFTSFKEFRDNYHKHFKKYSAPEEARANAPHILVERMEDWHFLNEHNMSHALQVSDDIFCNGNFN